MPTQDSRDGKGNGNINCHNEHPMPEVGVRINGRLKGLNGDSGQLIDFPPGTPLPKVDVQLTINGMPYAVSREDASLPLSRFLRDKALFKGVKVCCGQGACGTCVVAATFQEPGSNGKKTMSINSCLRPVYACDGWEITTSEGLGSRNDGFHVIQERIADYNGSQCGYCTPGWVMEAYSMFKENPKRSQQEVEDALDGHICRCTGYRPILDAMKSFATDGKEPVDIEELTKTRSCGKGGSCAGTCASCPNNDDAVSVGGAPQYILLKDANVYAPGNLEELYNIMRRKADQDVRLVCGNTATGVYPESEHDVYININGIAELKHHQFDGNTLELGANTSLSDMAAKLNELSKSEGFSYFASIAEHVLKVANTSVRNVGSWAGSLMLKQQHPDFPSDIFILLEAAEAKITLGPGGEVYSPSELMSLDMKQKVIIKLSLPKAKAGDRYWSYKLMPRHQSAYAYVNLAVKMNLDENYKVTCQPSIIFGGISGPFVHATKTEQYLCGKDLANNEVLQGSLGILSSEVNPTEDPALSSGAFRRNAAVSLYYKFVLSACNNRVGDRLKSGARELERPISTGARIFDSDKSKWPLHQPIPKVASKVQASGEAEYMDGITVPNQLHAVVVQTSVGNAKIDRIDTSAALAMPGVVRFISHKDIPKGGKNNFSPPNEHVYEEEIFCSGQVLFAGQAIGLILAETQEAATAGAKAVQVTYTDIQPPVLTMVDAMDKDMYYDKESSIKRKGDPEGILAKSAVIVEGKTQVHNQYHFHMENQGALCIPLDDGMEVYAGTQWVDQAQTAIAGALGVKSNSIHVQVKRLGGGFGGKISRNQQISAACAVAAYATNRPVRLVLPLSTNMEMIGKRTPALTKYRAGMDAEGKLTGVLLDNYTDGGASGNDNCSGDGIAWADNVYRCDNIVTIGSQLKTNHPSNTYCRGPGPMEAVFTMETIMEHLAKVSGRDPNELRKKNLLQQGDVTVHGDTITHCKVSELITEATSWADIKRRQQEIITFNQENRWKKRALSMVPHRWAFHPCNWKFNTLVSVLGSDGTVTISHGGVELGQGINTKVSQVAAYTLGIPLSMIRVLPTDTHANANSITTGGSMTTELCALGVIQCCNKILERMKPMKDKMPSASWLELSQACSSAKIDLCSRYYVAPEKVERGADYHSWGVCWAEAELDVLTGEHQLTDVHILYDCGTSLNPEIDIGQMEGGFILGLGHYLTEQFLDDPITGRNLTANAGAYHVPLAKDIPVNISVQFLRNAPNPYGVLGSKAIAEPAVAMSCVVLFAIKKAIEAARAEIGQDSYFEFNAPATTEEVHNRCLPEIKNYTLH